MRGGRNERIAHGFQITTLGIFGKEVQDALELYLRRHGYNAVVLSAPAKFSFEKVEYRPRKGAKLAKSDSKKRK